MKLKLTFIAAGLLFWVKLLSAEPPPPVINKEIFIKPSAPVVSWGIELPPKATAGLTVYVQNEGYKIKSGPTYNIGGAGPMLWTKTDGADEGTTFSFKVVNPVGASASTQAQVNCVWTPKTGTGTGGGGGTAPPDINGVATAVASRSKVGHFCAWSFDPSSQMADGVAVITYRVTVVDANGAPVTATFTNVAAANLPWKIDLPVGNVGTVSSVGASKGSLTATYTAPGSADAQTCDSGTTIYFVKLVRDSVAGADFIGTNAAGQDVYCTSKETSDVIVKLKTDPAAAPLPDNPVTWTGGNAGGSLLERKVPRGSLAEAGADVTALPRGGGSITYKVYVFEGAPTPKPLDIAITVKRDDAVVTGNWFGACERRGAYDPDETYSIYYSNKKWRFVFEKVAYDIKWGLKSQGRTDVPSGTVSPFPLGMGMAETTDEFTRKTFAKLDLDPHATGMPSKLKYWSSALTTRHELFHGSDWKDNYYTPRAFEAEALIEAEEVAVALANLAPAGVLAVKKPDFHKIYSDKITIAEADYFPDCETRAYADGKKGYEDLVKSIVP
ncbi:MAG TPA: Ig-like domain-containing protein [Chthoniobacteraceae bacterium]|jgi:hypothetical protein|nr:Ig-like domain-containing protein [Chthoniobacteraceae bacterium]